MTTGETSSTRRRRWVIASLFVLLVCGIGGGYWLFWSDSPPTSPRLPGREPTSEGLRGIPPREKARVMISTQPPGARILVEGVPTKRLTPDFVSVFAGRETTIVLEKDNFEPVRMRLNLEPNESREIDVVLNELTEF